MILSNNQNFYSAEISKIIILGFQPHLPEVTKNTWHHWKMAINILLLVKTFQNLQLALIGSQ